MAERDLPRVGAEPFDGNRFLQRLADAVRDRLADAGIEIAHFKMTLAPDTGNDLAVLNLVRHRRPVGVGPSARRRVDGGRADRQLAGRGRSGAAERDGASRGCNRRLARRASPRRSSTASISGPAGRSRRTGWRRHERPGPAHPLLPLRLREGRAAGGQGRRAERSRGSQRRVRRGAGPLRDGGARRRSAARARRRGTAATSPPAIRAR